MTNKQKLTLVKTLHTIIWIFFNVVIFYMLFAVIVGKLDYWLWVCYGFVLLEGFVLLLFRFTCPLTIIARRYTDEQRHNFDIYLPEWLAHYTQRIYTSLVVVIIVITLYQLLK